MGIERKQMRRAKGGERCANCPEVGDIRSIVLRTSASVVTLGLASEEMTVYLSVCAQLVMKELQMCNTVPIF